MLTKVLSKIYEIKNKLSLGEKLYMEQNSGLVVKDSNNGYNKSVELLASHINPDLDVPQDFPEFRIIRSTSRDGYVGNYKRHIMTLDVDDCPTQDSCKLITSGQLYDIINDLQNQINELKNSNNR